jgi:hypothetical protein
MFRLGLAFALATLLSGCMTSEDRAAAVVAADDDECRAYGAQPWTSPYIQCRMAITERRQETAEALTAVNLQVGPPPTAPPDGPQILMAPTPIAPKPPAIQSRY